MREHGVLKRILLIYGEAIRRIDNNEDLPPEPLADSAKIIRQFVEDYHEKLEEDFLFPRFEKANKLVDLVGVLLHQHQAGRRLTDITIHFATSRALADSSKWSIMSPRLKSNSAFTIWLNSRPKHEQICIGQLAAPSRHRAMLIGNPRYSR
jgi:hypothetical protein